MTIPEPPPTDPAAANEAARDGVTDALAASLTLATAALETLVDHRIAEANRAGDAVVALVQALRYAVPTTRGVTDVDLVDVDARMSLARQRVEALAVDPLWAAERQQSYLRACYELFASIGRLRKALADGRFEDADLVYVDVFVHYEAWRAAAGSLAAATAASPYLIWTEAGQRIGLRPD